MIPEQGNAFQRDGTVGSTETKDLRRLAVIFPFPGGTDRVGIGMVLKARRTPQSHSVRRSYQVQSQNDDFRDPVGSASADRLPFVGQA